MNQYWFRPKRYGYGATPIVWQGWVVTVGFGVLLAGSIIAMKRFAGPANTVDWLIWAAIIAVGVWWFVQFVRRRTDGEWRWRWGREN